MTESASEWFKRFPVLGKEPLFVVRVRLGQQAVAIRAWEGPPSAPNHTRLFCELRVSGIVIFPRASWYVGVPAGRTIDGRYAKELVVSLFCSKLSETEYTPEQRLFLERFGDDLMMAKIQRYGEG